MTYKVDGIIIIDSDAKIDWDKLVNIPIYFTSVETDQNITGVFGGTASWCWEIEDAGNRTLKLQAHDI